MRKFAFLTCPLNHEQLEQFWPITKIIPYYLLKLFLNKKHPNKIINISFRHNKVIEGYIFISPIILSKLNSKNYHLVNQKIASAIKLAEKLKVNLLGIDANIPISNDLLLEVVKKSKIPVTCGNTFSAWSVFESVFRTAKAKNLNLSQAVLSIIGEINPTISLCARKLSFTVKKIVILNKNTEKSDTLKKEIQELNAIDVKITKDIQEVFNEANILINNNCSFLKLVNLDKMKQNAVICDLSPAKDAFAKSLLRADIILIRSGIVKLPLALEINSYMGLAKDMVYSSLAETMLLALEEKFTNYSSSDTINLDKMEEIADIAVKHHFQIWVPDAPVL